jgi:hypothetical protein
MSRAYTETAQAPGTLPRRANDKGGAMTRDPYGFELDRRAPPSPRNPVPVPAPVRAMGLVLWVQTLSATDAIRLAFALCLAFWLVSGLIVANWETVRAVGLATLHSAPVVLYGWKFSGLIAWPRGH